MSAEAKKRLYRCQSCDAGTLWKWQWCPWCGAKQVREPKKR